MNPIRLICLFPLAYIVAWFYYLITWLIPLLNTPFNELASASLWTLFIAPMVFLTGGLALLIACVVLFIAIIVA